MSFVKIVQLIVYFVIKILHLLTCKPAAWDSHKMSSKRAYGYWLLVTETWVNAMYVLVNWKSYFAWRCGIRCDKTMSVVFTQNLFIKVKVVWNKSKRSLVISGLTCWVCLKAFKRSQKDQEWCQPSNIANAKHFQQAVNKKNMQPFYKRLYDKCSKDFSISLFIAKPRLSIFRQS